MSKKKFSEPDNKLLPSTETTVQERAGLESLPNGVQEALSRPKLEAVVRTPDNLSRSSLEAVSRHSLEGVSSTSLLSAETVSRFRDKFEIARTQGKAIALLCHDHPDPDSFGPAFALKTYFESIGIDAEIFHGGEVSHPENRAAQNILSIEMTESESLAPRKDEFGCIILMDAGATGGLNVRSTSVLPDIVIDHHDDESAPPKALVLRKRVGSVCTMVTHLLKALRFPFSDYPRAATALYLGLQTDTSGLTSELVTSHDLAAHALLITVYDQSAYRRILRYALPEALLRLKAMAYGPYFFRQGPLVVTGVGFVESAGKDMLAIIADEILRVEGITKTVVLGILKAERPAIIASVRTSVDTLNTHDFVQEIFGASHSGAKQGAGGAYVAVSQDLGDMIRQALAEDAGETIFRYVLKSYREKILRYPG